MSEAEIKQEDFDRAFAETMAHYAEMQIYSADQLSMLAMALGYFEMACHDKQENRKFIAMTQRININPS
jgi:hypothetical protein